MKIFDQEVPYDFNLFLISDDHEGNLLRHADGWDFMTDQVRSKYDNIAPWHNFVVHHGDINEGIQVDDKRYDGLTTNGCIYSQMQQAKRNLDPIRKNLVAVLDGNHSWKMWKFFGPGKPGMTETVCTDIGVRYGHPACVINYTCGGNTLFKHYAIHIASNQAPSSSVDDPKRKKTNIEGGLKRRLSPKFGDTLLMSCGHWHKMIYYSPESAFYVATDSGRMKSGYTNRPATVGKYIHPDHRHYVCCGSFLKTYGDGVAGYAEKAGFDPVELGYYIVRVRGGEIAGIDRQVLD